MAVNTSLNKQNSGINFAGTGLLSCGDIFDDDGSADRTIEVWAKDDGAGQYVYAKSKQQSSQYLGHMMTTRTFTASVTEDKVGYTYQGNDPATYRTVYANQAISWGDGKWYHLVFRRTSGTEEFFINGTKYSASVRSGSAARFNTSNAISLTIGGRSIEANTQYSYVKLAELRLWSIARTDTQIQENMYRRLQGNETNLVGYWPMDEGTGTVAYGGGTSGSDVTRTGTIAWVDGAPIQGSGAILIN